MVPNHRCEVWVLEFGLICFRQFMQGFKPYLDLKRLMSSMKIFPCFKAWLQGFLTHMEIHVRQICELLYEFNWTLNTGTNVFVLNIFRKLLNYARFTRVPVK